MRLQLHNFIGTSYLNLLWNVILKEHALQALDSDEVDEIIIENYRAMLLSYAHQRGLLPREQLVEIRYEDLRDDPLEPLGKIYGQLELGDVEAEAIRGFLESRPTYTAQAYETPAPLAERLAREWSEVAQALEEPLRP